MSDAATSVRERPIPFAGAMVRALLNGTKVQTRRVVKPQPPSGSTLEWCQWTGGWCENRDGACSCVNPRGCPYGLPGDRLWAREAWRTRVAHNAELPTEVGANGRSIMFEADYIEIGAIWGKYRHARFMPRALSRIVLEVTDVRVQRVQDITEEDARAEGVDDRLAREADGGLIEIDEDPAYIPPSIGGFARDNFRRLWDSINGAGTWDANPWVWSLTFKLVAP